MDKEEVGKRIEKWLFRIIIAIFCIPLIIFFLAMIITMLTPGGMEDHARQLSEEKDRQRQEQKYIQELKQQQFLEEATSGAYDHVIILPDK